LSESRRILAEPLTLWSWSKVVRRVALEADPYDPASVPDRPGPDGLGSARDRRNDTRGAASLLREQIGTVRNADVTSDLIARMDSSYYNGKAIKACRDLGACFSVTMRMDPKVRRRIAGIPDDAWVTIKYPRAIWDRRREGMDLRR
jgi:hypothetical protein